MVNGSTGLHSNLSLSPSLPPSLFLSLSPSLSLSFCCCFSLSASLFLFLLLFLDKSFLKTEYARFDNGRFVYRINRSPMCDYMLSFIRCLKHLPEKYMMNSVLENFTILQVREIFYVKLACDTRMLLYIHSENIL